MSPSLYRVCLHMLSCFEASHGIVERVYVSLDASVQCGKSASWGTPELLGESLCCRMTPYHGTNVTNSGACI